MRPIFLKTNWATNPPGEEKQVIAIFGGEHNGDKTKRLAYSLEDGWFVIDVVKTYGMGIAPDQYPEKIALEKELNLIGYTSTFAYMLIGFENAEVIDARDAMKLVGHKVSVIKCSEILWPLVKETKDNWVLTCGRLAAADWEKVDQLDYIQGAMPYIYASNLSFPPESVDVTDKEPDEVDKRDPFYMKLIVLRKPKKHRGEATLDDVIQLYREGRFHDAVQKYIQIGNGEISKEAAERTVEITMLKWFTEKEVARART